ncbi:MAG: hypothetical protein IJH39_04645, partial [Clostridia bacterium]|nr:hypothetical protein [Clostridia bacterium]
EKLPLKYKVSHLYTDGAQTEDKEIEGTKPQGTNHFEYEDVLTLDYPVNEYSIMTLIIKDKDNKELRTLEINMQTREITVKGEKEFEKISEIELKKYLNLFSELNNDWTTNDCLVAMSEKLITVGGEYEGYGIIPNDILGKSLRENSRRELINKIVKEIYGEKAEFEIVKNSKGQDVEVLKNLTAWEFDKKSDAYKELTAGEEYKNGHCLKIEDINYDNEVYTVKFVYLLATGYEEDDSKLEDLEQYETTIKLKRNENNQYSKYQIVSLEKGTKIKDKVNTQSKENTEVSNNNNTNTTENNNTPVNTNNNVISNNEGKVDNYVHYFNWIKYTAPGLKIEYPTELTLEKTGKQSQGEVSTIIAGTLIGRDVDTNQPIKTNIKIKIFNPLVVDENTMNNIRTNPDTGVEVGGYTTNSGLRWYGGRNQSDEKGYNISETYSNFNTTSNGVIEMRQIEFLTDVNSFKVTNLMNRMMGSTELANW